MPKPPDLFQQALDFAREQADVLNQTVTDGIRLGTALQENGLVAVGYGIGKANYLPKPIPLSIDQKPHRCALTVQHYLFLSDMGFLTVDASTYSVHLVEGDAPAEFLRYDFEREPDNEYPSAHLHVEGTCEAFDKLCERTGRTRAGLGRLHFPVGGKRFRPTLEDVIEFLILEGLVDYREGWKDVIEQGRQRFFQRQLKAAVVGDPDSAREALALLDDSDL